MDALKTAQYARALYSVHGDQAEAEAARKMRECEAAGEARQRPRTGWPCAVRSGRFAAPIKGNNCDAARGPTSAQSLGSGLTVCPSTAITCPDTSRAASEARKTAIFAMSRASTNRPIDVPEA